MSEGEVVVRKEGLKGVKESVLVGVGGDVVGITANAHIYRSKVGL